MLIPLHRQGPGLGTCQGHTSHQWQLFPLFSSAPAFQAVLGDTPLACPPVPIHRCPAAWRLQPLEARAVEGPDRRAAPRPTNPSPIVPGRLTSEDAVAGTAGPLEDSSRRPSKLGRWRQDPRRRTRRLLRLPSSAGARGGASTSSRDSGDPGGGGCDPCDVKRSSPKAVWGRREGEANPLARAAKHRPSTLAPWAHAPTAGARRGRDLRHRHQTLPCPHGRGAQHKLHNHSQIGRKAASESVEPHQLQQVVRIL